MNALWKIWLAVAGTLTTLYFVIPDSAETKLVLYNGVGLLSVILVLWGARKHKATPLEPWLWFAAGLGSFLVADIIYYMLEIFNPEGPPFPSVADFFYLSMYPLMIVGLIKMSRSVDPTREATSFIDAALVGVAMFGAMWVLFVDTIFLIEDNTTAALLVSLAYPVMDVALLAVAARLVVAAHLKHPPYAFISVAIASLAVADTAYGIYNASGSFETGLFIDFFWLAFYALFAAAALHPKVSVKMQVTHDVSRLTGRQLGIMFIATIGVPIIDALWGTLQDRVVSIIASATMSLLILLRVYMQTKTIQSGRERLRYDAEHDSLTGLANRSLFAERTRATLENRSPDGSVAVLFIDLDDFKTVNDSLGHEAGDVFLTEVARRLSRCVRDNDTIARFGGDEFAVLLESGADRHDAVTVARRALEVLDEPMMLGDRTVRASASIGIATYDDATNDVESLLRNADVAMYLSKSRGKGRFEFFESKMHDEAIERLDLKADLQRALDRREFVLHYQPIFDLQTGRVALVEALVRWRHPDRGLVPPDRFIPLAEESGLIVELGEWVLREACTEASKWHEIAGCEDIGVTVNLSMRQLQDGQLINTLTGALKDSGLPAESLVLEITESMLAQDSEHSAGVLRQLKTVGVRMAIDDFGTGYSSLSYLRSFPVDSIKIDRSFINELHRSSTSTALIEAIVNLSQALGAYTVAEGIEHADQAATLRKLGCDQGQGYYYCRPISASALTQLFKEPLRDEAEPLEAWRRSSEKVQKRIFDVDVLTSLPEISAMSADIVALNEELNTPLMASWPWLRNWSECFSSWTPLLVAIRSADTGQLRAAAMLATMERAEGTAIVAMGNGSSLFTSLQALDDDAAHALAGAVAATLSEISGAWSLDLEQLRDSDATLRYLVDELDHAQLLPELRVPRVLFTTAHTVDDVLSKSMRKQLRRARNKISNAGVDMTIAFDRGSAISMALIDEVESVHVARDRDARRSSDLDRPAERDFWRRIAESPDQAWEVEIATLRLDGELAAYVVALLDDETYRVYDGRMNSKWQQFSPGRIIEAQALSRAITDPRFNELDWMSGIAAEKLLTTNIAEGRARLVATSGSSYLSAPKRSRKKQLTKV